MNLSVAGSERGRKKTTKVIKKRAKVATYHQSGAGEKKGAKKGGPSEPADQPRVGTRTKPNYPFCLVLERDPASPPSVIYPW
jgi:hypothetical protein